MVFNGKVKYILVAAMCLILTACGSKANAEDDGFGMEDSRAKSSSASDSSTSGAATANQSFKAKLEAKGRYTARDVALAVFEQQKQIAVGTDTITASDAQKYTFKYTGKFNTTNKYFNTLGTENVEIEVTTPDGKSMLWSVDVEVVDTTAPVFNFVEKLECDEDETIDIKGKVVAVDAIDGEVEVTALYDKADKDTSAVGEHKIIYSATDKSGNKGTAETTLTINKVFEAKNEDMYVLADGTVTFADRHQEAKSDTLIKGTKVHVNASVIGTKLVRIEVNGKTVFVPSSKLTKEDPIAKEKAEKEKEEAEKKNSDNGNSDNGNSNNDNGNSNNGGGNNNSDNGNSNNGGNGNSDNGNSNNGGGNTTPTYTEPEPEEETPSNNDGGNNDNGGGGYKYKGDYGDDGYYMDDQESGYEYHENAVLMHGDPFGWGFEYDYWYDPTTGECWI
ncbi:hypothetical protein [Ruminococcus sp.]|uniref:hypothetical protein n=1 Tax=Ruminococcus sp. TaxID=41978 RepID=UPI0025E03921|nr:hypothetical protein [Ruminococcus sp.]MBQ8965191.1 hypothetical protein [Ruminococcus sp.]